MEQFDQGFWMLLVAQLPIVAVVIVALYRKYLYTGSTVQEIIAGYEKRLEEKDEEIEFREQLRQEAIADKNALAEHHQITTDAVKEITGVITKSLDLNDRLINERLADRWGGK